MSLAVQRGEQELERLQAAGKPHMAGSLQAIVVAPSRELAMQIVRVGQSLLPDGARGCVQQAIGGANPHRQVWVEVRTLIMSFPPTVGRHLAQEVKTLLRG